MNGWFRLHRQLHQSKIWKKSTPEQKVILITLLIMTNYCEKISTWKGTETTLQPGQFLTSIEKISRFAGKGITVNSIRTALKKFEKYGFLTNESTKFGRLITIENWMFYQNTNVKTTNEMTNDKQYGGWIKLHRKLVYSPIWQCTTPKQKVILIILLLSANYKENTWMFNGNSIHLYPGQFKTSLNSILEKSGTNISTRNIRTTISNLEKLEFLTNKSTKSGRLITIENWEVYQSEDVYPTIKPTKNRQNTSNQLTSNKNITNKEYTISPVVVKDTYTLI